MKAAKRENTEAPSLLDVVALLKDVQRRRLVRGQVGAVVERLDDETLMVEFSDDQGRGYAIEPCARTDLLVLRYVPEPA